MDNMVTLEVTPDIKVKTEIEGEYEDLDEKPCLNYEGSSMNDTIDYIKREPEYIDDELTDGRGDYAFVDCKLDNGYKRPRNVKRKSEEVAECGGCTKCFIVGSLQYIIHCKEDHGLIKSEAINWMVEEHLKNNKKTNPRQVLCCPNCLKQCESVEEVKNCVASHLDDVPKELICKVEYCKTKKPFKTRKTYLNHLRSAHNMVTKGKEKMTYTCNVCCEQYSSKWTLTRHNDRFHKDVLIGFENCIPPSTNSNDDSLHKDRLQKDMSIGFENCIPPSTNSNDESLHKDMSIGFENCIPLSTNSNDESLHKDRFHKDMLIGFENCIPPSSNANNESLQP